MRPAPDPHPCGVGREDYAKIVGARSLGQMCRARPALIVSGPVEAISIIIAVHDRAAKTLARERLAVDVLLIGSRS